jgi:hypothetical protein
MKFFNFIKSLLLTAPKITEEIIDAKNEIVQIPDAVAEAIANNAVPKPKRKKVAKKK